MLSTQTITEYLDCNRVHDAIQALVIRADQEAFGALLTAAAHHLAGDGDTDDGAYESALRQLMVEGIDPEALVEELLGASTPMGRWRFPVFVSHVALVRIPEYRDWREEHEADLLDAEMDRRYDASRGN